MKDIVVLISGRGSNLQSIIDATKNGRLPVRIAAVISNNPGAQGLERAQRANIPTHVLNHRDFSDRAKFDTALMQLIDQLEPAFIVLAGFMRVLGAPFIRHYTDRMINIHPSLLPDYPGLNTHARALDENRTEHGASVHFVTEKVDAGPIIIQGRVPIRPNDTPESLAARVLEEEHRIYPLAISWLAENRLTIAGDKALLDGKICPEQGLTL